MMSVCAPWGRAPESAEGMPSLRCHSRPLRRTCARTRHLSLTCLAPTGDALPLILFQAHRALILSAAAGRAVDPVHFTLDDEAGTWPPMPARELPSHRLLLLWARATVALALRGVPLEDALAVSCSQVRSSVRCMPPRHAAPRRPATTTAAGDDSSLRSWSDA